MNACPILCCVRCMNLHATTASLRGILRRRRCSCVGRWNPDRLTATVTNETGETATGSASSPQVIQRDAKQASACGLSSQATGRTWPKAEIYGAFGARLRRLRPVAGARSSRMRLAAWSQQGQSSTDACQGGSLRPPRCTETKTVPFRTNSCVTGAK